MIEQERIEAKGKTRARGQRVNNILTAQATANDLPGGAGFTEAVQDVVGALVAAAGGSYDDVTGAITLPSGGSGLAGVATVTVPANSLGHTETVAATGVIPTSIVIAAIAPHADADENDAEFLDVVALSASPGTDEITFDLAFSAPTQGAIKLNWSAI